MGFVNLQGSLNISLDNLHVVLTQSYRYEGVFDDNFFLFLIETISCDPSSEPSRRDGSDEGSQPMFLCRNNKNYP